MSSSDLGELKLENIRLIEKVESLQKHIETEEVNLHLSPQITLIFYQALMMLKRLGMNIN